MRTLNLLLLALLLCSCCRPLSQEYRQFYSHLEELPHSQLIEDDSDYFLVLLVDARHLDYTECRSFLRTVAKHPSDGSKNGDVGHAWIYLQGIIAGRRMYLEGGHTGETGLCQSRYLDGIMNNIDYGYPNPPPNCIVRYEPNPVRYLWQEQTDGFFQQGSGGHRPTYAIRVPLTPEQFHAIVAFIDQYPFARYSLTEAQCTTFVVQVAALAGLDLPCEAEIAIPSTLFFRNTFLRLWTDPCYALLRVPSPDVLEKSMMQAVREGRAAVLFDKVDLVARPGKAGSF